ncbi:MAG: hypothetical protein ABIJ12_10930 [bacterium]
MLEKVYVTYELILLKSIMKRSYAILSIDEKLTVYFKLSEVKIVISNIGHVKNSGYVVFGLGHTKGVCVIHT